MDYRAVFHLHEEENAVPAIANLNNLLKDLGAENVEAELLMNGTGVKVMKKNSEHKNRIRYLSDKGVTFKVCGNSLEGLKIDKGDLLDEAEIVSAGVSELVKKQAEGWAYIKP